MPVFTVTNDLNRPGQQHDARLPVDEYFIGFHSAAVGTEPETAIGRMASRIRWDMNHAAL